uniref:Uncharacterized protein n=1 Tax=Setaria viridis TaxID=4556 RepID=A0A4U6V580_SETVI|nr:hypothetical protein SEVIR_4G239901v2 [Setaria viridis]
MARPVVPTTSHVPATFARYPYGRELSSRSGNRRRVDIPPCRSDSC